MLAAWLLLGDANPGLREWLSQVLKAAPILACLILVLALVVTWLKRRRAAEEETLSPSDQLEYFQKLHWKGELSKEEFERIQSKLGERIRQEQALANPAVPPNHPDKPGTPQPPETGTPPQPPG